MKKSILCHAFILATVFAFAGPNTPACDKNGVIKIEEILKNAHAASNKTAATNNTAYLLVGERQDLYNQTTSSWDFSDSTDYNFDDVPNDTLINHLDYIASSSEWRNSQRQRFTFSGTKATEILYQTWDVVSSSYVNYYKIVNNYDSDRNLIDRTNQTWDSGSNSWKGASKYIYTYDNNHNQLTYVYQYWDDISSSWANSSKYIRTFDGAHRIISDIHLSWNASSYAFINDTRSNYTYDAQGNNTYADTQNWDASNNVWVNSYQANVTYSADNQMSGYIYQVWNDSSNSWVNYEKLVVTFDANSRIAQELYQNWDSPNFSWLNNYKQVYTYSVYNTTTKEQYYWDVAANSYDHIDNKSVSIYENGEYLTVYEVFDWNNTNNRLEPYFKYEYFFDAYGNQIEADYSLFDPSVQEYHYQNRHYYYYQSFTVSGIDETANVSNMNMYPNPATGGQAIVAFNLKTEATIAINMYDINGRLVTSQTNQFGAGYNKANIETGKLANGIYQVQWVNLKDNSTATLKLLVQ